MITNAQLFMLPTELYRIGSKSSPRLEKVRVPRDISFSNIYELNGIAWIRAGKHGVSLFTLKGIMEKIRFFDPDDMVWQLPMVLNVPFGLGLENDHGSHYLIFPITNMPLDEFKGKLAEIAKQAKAYLNIKSLTHV